MPRTNPMILYGGVLIVLCCSRAASAVERIDRFVPTRTFTIISRPIALRNGEVHHKWQSPIELPMEVRLPFKKGGKIMAVVDWAMNIMREDGTLVPQYEVYNRRTLWTTNSADDETLRIHAPYGESNEGGPTPQSLMRGFRGVGGPSALGTSHKLPDGYAWFVHQPETITPHFHLINTRAPPSLPQNQLEEGETSKLLECPCTPQRVIDEDNGTVDGASPFPPFGTCNWQLSHEPNPSCALSTYRGGTRCCKHGVFVIDTDEIDTNELPEEVVFGTITITYLDDRDAAEAKDMNVMEVTTAMIDATSSIEKGEVGQYEFDVPQVSFPP